MTDTTLHCPECESFSARMTVNAWALHMKTSHDWTLGEAQQYLKAMSVPDAIQ